jgi:hypothetical protein
MIIGLTGYAQSGKDTAAKILTDNYKFERVAFADPIRNLLLDVNPMVDYVAGEPVFLASYVKHYGWEAAKKNPRIRALLQTLGVSARNHIDEFVWIATAFRKMGDLGANYVITDVRFENEADQIKAIGGQIWRIERSGVKAVNSHVSESQMDQYPVDQTFTNNGTIEDLQVMINTRMSGVLTHG